MPTSRRGRNVEDLEQDPATGKLIGLRGTIIIEIVQEADPRETGGVRYDIVVGDKQRFVLGDGWNTAEKAVKVAVIHAVFDRARAKLILRGQGIEALRAVAKQLAIGWGLKVEVTAEDPR